MGVNTTKALVSCNRAQNLKLWDVYVTCEGSDKKVLKQQNHTLRHGPPKYTKS